MDHLKVHSGLPTDLEALVHDAIGCCLAVHIALGSGWLEGVYSRAVAIELTARRISFEKEKAIQSATETRSFAITGSIC